MIWFGKKSKIENNQIVDDKKLLENKQVDIDEERQKKLQETDELITIILPVINNK